MKKFTMLVLLAVITISLCACQALPRESSHKARVSEETENTTSIEPTQTSIQETSAKVNLQEPFELSAGTYVVGENIQAGKYDIVAVAGGGDINIYTSLGAHKRDEIYAVRARYVLAVADPFVSVMDSSTSVTNVRLLENECMIIDDGITVQVIEKGSTIQPEEDLSYPLTLSAGTYVEGEDIQSGKYDFLAVEGGSAVLIYASLDAYKLEEVFEYQSIYNLAAADSKTMEYLPDLFKTSASNVRLDDGECLVIETGLVVEITKK